MSKHFGYQIESLSIFFEASSYLIERLKQGIVAPSKSFALIVLSNCSLENHYEAFTNYSEAVSFFIERIVYYFEESTIPIEVLTDGFELLTPSFEKIKTS